ncbi:hypothetical protein H696_04643 [Fonticula alba]|uniref:Mitochondrial import inner membrane translocase subunit TIM23 n=1 Tax=Fonticula alba TaxID=691883 RepID=A0A058Z513_FONAL|nr:hypothetical protein H696_04643 [Fonticula alba]KCV69226.1 hypothetical protein H696_04643 [Fonticula alba]|eukprot:XP_009496797.1 hypothetical protein H696_04643 [Fonticula alba]
MAYNYNSGSGRNNYYNVDYDSHGSSGYKPEVLFEDEFVPGQGKRLSWNDKLFFGTGYMYLIGLGIGGTWGAVEGFRYGTSLPQTGRSLLVNATLNGITRRGPFLGNNMAVVGFSFAAIDTMLDYATGEQSHTNRIIAGGLTGLLLRSLSGPRVALTSGAIGLALGTAFTFIRPAFEETFYRR